MSTLKFGGWAKLKHWLKKKNRQPEMERTCMMHGAPPTIFQQTLFNRLSVSTVSVNLIGNLVSNSQYPQINSLVISYRRHLANNPNREYLNTNGVLLAPEFSNILRILFLLPLFSCVRIASTEGSETAMERSFSTWKHGSQL